MISIKFVFVRRGPCSTLIVSHVPEQIELRLVVLEVITTLLDGPSLQVLRYLDEILAVLLETRDIDVFLVLGPLVGARVRGSAVGLTITLRL